MKSKKSSNTQPKVKLIQGGVAHAPGNPDDLAKLLNEHNAMQLAVETLIDMLGATVEVFDKAQKMFVVEVDGATRTKAAQLLLAYSVGEPVKRQQILSGKLPQGPVTKEGMREIIDRKLWERLNRPDVTTAELVAAQRSIVEDEKKVGQTPLTEEQAVAEARRIHGMIHDESSPLPAPAEKD
jgi:hypothetical protein